MKVSIVETICDGERAAEIERYLVGLGDLGWVDDLLIGRPNGEIVRIRNGRSPAVFEGLELALEADSPERVELLSVVLLPVLPFPPDRRLIGPDLEIIFDTRVVQVDKTLLICPTGPDDSDLSWAESIGRLDDTPTIWDRRLILSPEDQVKPQLVPQRIGAMHIVSHAAAAASVLSGAIDPAIRASDLVVANGDSYRVVRTFARTADMEGAVNQLVSSVLDQDHGVYEGEAHARLSDSPDKIVQDSSGQLANTHRLKYAPGGVEPERLEVGLLAALKMLIEYVVAGLKRLPKRLLDRTRAEAIRRLEAAVSSVVLGVHKEESMLVLKLGGPNTPRPIDADELDQHLADLRAEFLTAADPDAIERWLPATDPPPEERLFREFLKDSHALLDGGLEKNPVLVPEEQYVAPEPLDPEVAVAMMAAVDHLPPERSAVYASLISSVPNVPLQLITSDPWRLSAAIEMLDYSSDNAVEPEGIPEVNVTSEESSGDESDSETSLGDVNLVPRLVTELRRSQHAASRAFGYQVGSVILASLDRARRSFVDRLIMLSDDKVNGSWNDRPETSARRRVFWLVLMLFGGVAAAVTLGVVGVFALVVAVVIAASCLLLSIIGFVWSAIRYQRDAFQREHQFRQRTLLLERIREDWTAIQRFSALYRQYRDWSAIITADIYRPVGHLGRIVVYGGQQTKPRWLATARSLQVSGAEEQRIRRSIFQCGWRGAAFRDAYRMLLDDYTERNKYTEEPNPASDVRDAFGSRNFLVEEFAWTGRASVMKRDYLESIVRRDFVLPDGGLVSPEEVTEVIGRYEAFDSLDQFFDLSSTQGFSGFLFAENSPVTLDGFGEPRDVVESILTCPAMFDPPRLDDQATVRISDRLWPQLSAVRLDISGPMHLVEVPEGAGANVGLGPIDLRNEGAGDQRTESMI